MNKLYRSKPYSPNMAERRPFQYRYVDYSTLDIAGTNLFILGSNAISLLNSPRKPFAFTCRQGRVVMTACDIQPNEQYQIARVHPESWENPYLTDATIITSEEMTNSICPLLTKGSPYVTQDNKLLKQSASNSYEVKGADRLKIIPTVEHDIFSTSSQSSHRAASKENPYHIKHRIEYSCTVSGTYHGPSLNYHQKEIKGTAQNMYYNARTWEAIVCTSPAKELPISVAVCAPDGKFHIASLMTTLFPKSTDLSSVFRKSDYTCYTKDKMWTRYHQVASANNVTEKEYSNLLSSAIYPAIRNTIIDASCSTESQQKSSDYITLQFNANLAKTLIANNTNTNFSNAFLSNPIVKNSQFDQRIPSSQIYLPAIQQHHSKDSESNFTQSDIITSLYMVFVGAVMLVTAGICACIRKGIKMPSIRMPSIKRPSVRMYEGVGYRRIRNEDELEGEVTIRINPIMSFNLDEEMPNTTLASITTTQQNPEDLQSTYVEIAL